MAVNGVKSARMENTKRDQAKRERWAVAGGQAREAAFIGVSRREDHVDMR